MEKTNHRKSICFLTHDLMVGGLENVLIEAVNTLHTDYRIRIVCLYGEFQKAVTDRFPNDVEVIYRQMKRTQFSAKPVFSRFFFKEAIGSGNFDYIIALKGFERYACRCKGKSRFIYWCFNDFHSRYLHKNLTWRQRRTLRKDRRLYRGMDAVWTVTSGIAEESNTLYKTSIFEPLPLSIDCNAITQKLDAPCEIVFDSAKTNIVLLGRVSPEKGFTRVLAIMPSLYKAFPHVHLHIIGGGDTVPQLQKLCVEKGLDGCITFWGQHLNPFPILKQAQLFVCPSAFESFGLVMMEAMYVGIPLIATATTGGKYVTQNGTFAKCVENTDEALQSAVTEFLQAPGNYGYSLSHARQWAQDHDSVYFAQRLQNMLEKIGCKAGKNTVQNPTA